VLKLPVPIPGIPVLDIHTRTSIRMAQINGLITQASHTPSSEAVASGHTDRALYNDAYYQGLHGEHWFRNNRAKMALRWQEILRMVAPQSEDVIVDLGCAVGTYTRKISPLCSKVIGVDFSEAAIRQAGRVGPAVHPNVHFHVGEVTNLSFLADNSVDKAMAIDLVEHLDDETLDGMAREVRRVLKPGGSLAIYTPCRTHYVERLKAHHCLLRQLPGHIAVRRPEEYLNLFSRSGWHVEQLYYSPSAYPVLRWLDRLLPGLPGVGSFFRFRICLVACTG